MLEINFEKPVVISNVTSGVREDGTTWCMYRINEADNVENSRSKSMIKCWGDKPSKDIVPGSLAVLKSLGGIRLVHAKIGEKYGSPIFRDEYHLTGVEFEAV